MDDLRKVDAVIVELFKGLINLALALSAAFFGLSAPVSVIYAFLSFVYMKWAEGFGFLIFGILGYYIARALIEITKESGKQLANHGKEV